MGCSACALMSQYICVAFMCSYVCQGAWCIMFLRRHKTKTRWLLCVPKCSLHTRQRQLTQIFWQALLRPAARAQLPQCLCCKVAATATFSGRRLCGLLQGLSYRIFSGGRFCDPLLGCSHRKVSGRRFFGDRKSVV